MITESDDLSLALDRAATLWPELADNRTALLRRILEQGMLAMSTQAGERLATRTAAIADIERDFDGLWPEDWLEKMKSEWPD
jgi:hypothetical protein